jgi:hypothetical protein
MLYLSYKKGKGHRKVKKNKRKNIYKSLDLIPNLCYTYLIRKGDKEMENFITKVGEMDIKVANDKINQVQRNSLKADFMEGLIEFFAEKGIELHKTTEGLVLKVEGKEHDIHIALDPVVKNLDFDLIASVDEHNAKVETRVERQQALAKAKEKRLAEKQKKTKL